jgi:hypothetical protein
MCVQIYSFLFLKMLSASPTHILKWWHDCWLRDSDFSPVDLPYTLKVQETDPSQSLAPAYTQGGAQPTDKIQNALLPYDGE